MAKGDERDRPEGLYPFAEALVRKLKVRSFGVRNER